MKDYIKSNHPYLESGHLKTIKSNQFDHYLYYCGIAYDNKMNPIKTDSFIEVYDIIASKNQDGTLNEIANFNSFSSTEEYKCHIHGTLADFIPKLNLSKDYCENISSTDTERKEILDGIRGSLRDKFIVKRLCASSSFAYFCGLSQDSQGYVNNTNGALDVNDIILKKTPTENGRELRI